jgi:hypothetical protein
MRTLALAALLAVVALPACAVSPEEAGTDDQEASQATTVTVRFGADGKVTQTKPIVGGNKIKIVYDEARTRCTGTMYGKPAFSVTANWRVNGGPVQTVVVAGLAPTGTLDPTFVAPSVAAADGTTTGDLELWFESSSRWGCHEWDSDFGKNFHFSVAPPKSAPQWVGNGAVVISRATCGNGGACDQDRRPLGGGFLYDTWAAQRAAIRQVSFDVYEAGVTDRADPEMWKKVDARMYSRIGSQGAFQMRYVDLGGRVGNDARYVVDLRSLAPFAGNTVTDPQSCPKFPFTTVGPYVEADVQFYFTVDGVEIRPADGTVFHGRYQDYADLYKVCTQH